MHDHRINLSFYEFYKNQKSEVYSTAWLYGNVIYFTKIPESIFQNFQKKIFQVISEIFNFSPKTSKKKKYLQKITPTENIFKNFRNF